MKHLLAVTALLVGLTACDVASFRSSEPLRGRIVLRGQLDHGDVEVTLLLSTNDSGREVVRSRM